MDHGDGHVAVLKNLKHAKTRWSTLNLTVDQQERPENRYEKNDVFITLNLRSWLPSFGGLFVPCISMDFWIYFTTTSSH